ncbi:AraC family transcriptional regulator [Streptomyces griseoaurantiacus]|uniref:AraC family transcriptional regulator n=1 Tax=Streptomyces griseoaurantiacus TaxID=68213 RepID=UPI0036AC239B
MTVLSEGAHRAHADDAVLRALAAYKRYETHDLAVAEGQVRQFMAPGRLRTRPGHRGGVDARAFYADTGSVGVGFMGYGADVTVDRRGDSRYLGIAIPLSGHIRVLGGGEAVLARAGESIVVIAPDGPFLAEWSADCDTLMLRVTTTALAHAARTLTGARDTGRPPRFAHQVLPLDRGHAVRSAARLLAETFGRYGDVAAVPGGLLRLLSEHTLSAVLLGLDHDLAAPAGPAFRAAPGRAVREAMRLVEDETTAVFNVGELARHLGVTVRALELGFRRALDETPHHYLRRIRLERAHRELLAADPVEGATVAGIASRWGFAHAGRFAASHKAAYGVTPSVSLRTSPRGGTAPTVAGAPDPIRTTGHEAGPPRVLPADAGRDTRSQGRDTRSQGRDTRRAGHDVRTAGHDVRTEGAPWRTQ